MEMGPYARPQNLSRLIAQPWIIQKTPKRKYELKKRADEMAETRRRITEAAVELHGTVGPARTTLSAVAERAGVQRHTVYRHFPTEADLFGACSAHYFTAHPWPDLEPWRAISDPHQRLARGAGASSTPTTSAPNRCSATSCATPNSSTPFARPWYRCRAYLAEAAEILAAGWPTRGRRRRVLAAALRHAVDFQTWRSLAADNRITRTEAVELVTALVEAAAARRPAMTA